MKTKRIYYFESSISQREAVITNIGFDEDRKCYFLELDETIFFPEGGGQFPDTGTIDSIAIVDVREDKEGHIYHYLTPGDGVLGSKPGDLMTPGDGVLGSKPGDRVNCKIDYKKRFDRMQQHTGEHIVSGLVNEAFGYDNVGFHLGEEFTTLDFSGELSPEDIKNIELRANQAVWANIPIISRILSPEEVDTLNYRSKKELEGDVRIVEIPGIDICACCAPHMDHTGQVGLIKIVDYMRHRGGMRLTMLAGERALLDYHKCHDEIRTLSSLLSLKPGTLAGGVSKLMEDNKAFREANIREKETALSKEIEQQMGKDIILLFGDELNKVVVKHCLDKALDLAGKMAGVLNGNDRDGYAYALASKEEDLTPLVKELNKRFEGKGGGKPLMANGRIMARETDIKEFFNLN